jgi:hypothetical protein
MIEEVDVEEHVLEGQSEPEAEWVETGKREYRK